MTPRKPANRVLSHERFARARTPDATERELGAVREIAHALATADRPDEVFQFALDRTSALIGASFASVYVVEGVSELMRLVAASNWPQKYRPWLSEMRVRIGFGPSGEAAAERRVIEVPDVLADGGLEDWAEVARELGFRSLVALPLQEARGALGAVTFYFAAEGAPAPERRQLMRLVADQMAAAAVRARMAADLRRASAALAEAQEELERIADPGPAKIDPDGMALATSMVAELSEPVADALAILRQGGDPRAAALVARVDGRLADWAEWLALTVPDGTTPDSGRDQVVPRELALRSCQLADEWIGGEGVAVKLVPGEAPHFLTDLTTATRLVASLLVFAESRAPGMPVSLIVSADDAEVQFVVRDAGPPPGREQVDALFDPVTTPAPRVRQQPTIALARALATSLGGSLTAQGVPGQGLQLTCRLPISRS